MFVESHVSTSAVVHLDEVEVPVAEVELAVLILMTSEAHSETPRMTVARSARVVACIAIDTRLQTQRVDVIYQSTHAVRKQLRVQTQMTVFTTTVPVAVVDIHILVSCLLQTSVVHCIGLLANQLFVDVQSERVP